MLRFGTVTRKLSETYHVFHKEGVAGVTTYLRWRFVFHSQMLSAKKIASVTVDGCTVNLKRLPNSKTKLDLVNDKYEIVERHLVPKHLEPELPVIELGGCIGVIACITNRMLKNPGRHVVVEANPLAIPLLVETRDSNQCKFEILSKAVAYGVPSVTFRPTLNLCANTVQQEGGEETSVTVPATSLRDIVTKRNFGSFTLICDIEGSEYDLVFNEADVLKNAATIILETHSRFIGEAKNTELLEKLEDLGFRVVDQEATVIVLKQSPVSNSRVA